MSGVSDLLGLILVEAGESYDEEVLNSNNKTIDAYFKKLKFTTASYAPTFTGFTSQGTSAVKNGSYVRIGKLVMFNFYLKAGTGGNMGSAQLTVSLPFKISNSNEDMYYGKAGLHSPGITGAIYPLEVVGNQDSSVGILFASNPNAKNGLTTPGTLLYPFAKDDVIRGHIFYITDAA